MLPSIHHPLLCSILLVILIIMTTTTVISNEDAYATQANINKNNNNNFHSQLDALSRDLRSDLQTVNYLRETRVSSSSPAPLPPVILGHQATPTKQQSLWQQNDERQQSDLVASVHDTRTWFAPNGEINLRELMNVGQPMMNQEDAKKLEEYMINYAKYSDGSQGNSVPLNLANINNRPLLVANPRFTSTATSSSIRMKPLLPASPAPIDSRHQISNSAISSLAVPEFIVPSQRADQLEPAPEQQLIINNGKQVENRHDGSTNNNKLLTRKGKVDDVVVFNGNNKYILPRGTGVAKKLVHDHLVQTLPPGCIGRAAPYTVKCEDHLVKRLSQDATEGRTVLDVSRRVCCALFSHKDCISSVVVELCPDSNPKAAELLLGSRNLDLTMSCQRFNRDGCNGSPSSLNYSLVNHSIVLIVTLVTTFWCMNTY